MGAVSVPARQQPASNHVVPFDERWQDVWRRRCRGETFVQIAKDLGVNRSTVLAWYDKYCALEVARTADPEAERAFLVGRFEQLAAQAIEAFDSCHDSRARPEHMTNAIRALQMVARLGGFDVQRKVSLHQHRGESEVVIRVGGQEMVRRRVVRDPEVMNGQAIEAPSREVEALAGDRDGEMVP